MDNDNKTEELELYVLPGCPYCAKVLNVLDAMELPYSTVEVPSSHSKREKVQEISGQTSVPVLNDPNNDIKGMNESSHIVEYLENEYSYPEDYEPPEDEGVLSYLLSKLS